MTDEILIEQMTGAAEQLREATHSNRASVFMEVRSFDYGNGLKQFVKWHVRCRYVEATDCMTLDSALNQALKEYLSEGRQERAKNLRQQAAELEAEARRLEEA